FNASSRDSATIECMKIFSGSSNKPLAEKIAKELHLSLSPLEIHVFPDKEKRIQVQERVVDEDCIIVESTAPPANENYMELFFIVDALKRSGAKTVTVVVPYLGYQRQDHVFRSGEAVSLEVVATTLEAVGMDKLITVDLHSIKIPEVFHVPIAHLSALPLFAQKIKELHIQSKAVLVSPDMGGIRRIKLLSEMLADMPYAAIEKERNLQSGVVTANVIHGDIGQTAFIVDDMISSGKTIETAAKLLQEKGATTIYVFASHPVFSEEAKEILEKTAVEKVFVTDTIDVPEKKHFPKLE